VEEQREKSTDRDRENSKREHTQSIKIKFSKHQRFNEKEEEKDT
jgi:hypothetical protein